MQADVVIVGAGMAGLSLARQLALEKPRLKVMVVEQGEARHRDALRLGESTSEVGAGYLDDRLGLGDALRAHHQPKAGLRFFFARAAGVPFDQRGAYGGNSPRPQIWSLPFTETTPPTFQLHRGKLEHHLAHTLPDLGVSIHYGARDLEVDLGPPHLVRARMPHGPLHVQAKWVVDATARRRVVARHFTQVQTSEHAIQASWLWTRRRIDPDRFSDTRAYQERCPPDIRWRGTNHLFGDGYWVWVINHRDPLTSIGVVQPRGAPPISDLPTWLHTHEPELAAQLGVIEDQGAGSYQADRVATLIDPRGLAAVGDAAATADPLYSPGMDLIAITNRLVAAAIVESSSGADLKRHCRFANPVFQQLHAHYLTVYRGLYALCANPEALACKIAWDNAVYFALLAPWLRSDSFTDPTAFAQLASVIQRVGTLHANVSALFGHWPAPADGPAVVFDQAKADFLMDTLAQVHHPVQGDALRQRLEHNARMLEDLAVSLTRRYAARQGAELPHDPLNPYLVTPGLDDPGLQRGRRRREGLGVEVSALWST